MTQRAARNAKYLDRRPPTPLARAVAETLAASTARPATVASYSSLGRIVAAMLPGAAVEYLTPATVEAAIAAAARSGAYAPKTLHNALGFLRMVLRRYGSHAAAAVRIRVPEADIRPLSAREAETLRGVLAPGDPCDDALLALLGTGLRLAELERARAREYDPTSGYAARRQYEPDITFLF